MVICIIVYKMATCFFPLVWSERMRRSVCRCFSEHTPSKSSHVSQSSSYICRIILLSFANIAFTIRNTLSKSSPLTISTTFRLSPNSTTTWSFYCSRFNILRLYTVRMQIYPKYWKQSVMNICIFWGLKI